MSADVGCLSKLAVPSCPSLCIKRAWHTFGVAALSGLLPTVKMLSNSLDLLLHVSVSPVTAAKEEALAAAPCWSPTQQHMHSNGM